MEHVACNLCGSDRARTVYQMPDILFHPDEWFTVVECLGCGLGFVNPRPGPAEIGRYYPPAFYADFTERARDHERRYAREAAFLFHGAPRPTPGARLLDIGCAEGHFARHMRHHYALAVEGVEPSAAAAPIEEFPCHRGLLPALDLPAGRYDYVTAWAVLEHTHDPKSYFEAVARLLKPGGRFAFLVTNFESLSSRALFREDPPRHLYFFTPRTIERYLAAAGLRRRRMAFDGRIYEMKPVNWLPHLLRRLKGLPPLTYETLPETRAAFTARRGLRPGLGATLRHLAHNPAIALDRLAMPLFSAWQIMCRTYGIVAVLAEKPR